MTNQLDDLTGQRFGLLTVVKRAPNDRFGTVYWRCRCDCSEEKLVRGNQLRQGRFFTCGKPACRFFEKVYIPKEDGCWEWTGGLVSGGYGAFKAEEKTVRAHVFAYEQAHGPIKPLSPEEGCPFVLHKCDNRKCVRASHLFLGTHQDNMDDMVKKGRQHRGPRPRLDS